MRLISAFGMAILGMAGAFSPAIGREPAPTVAEPSAKPLTFAIQLPETHRATGRVGRMVAFTAEQLSAKGYRPTAPGQAPDLIVKLRFEDNWFSSQRNIDMGPERAPTVISSGMGAAAANVAVSTTGDAMPYPSGPLPRANFGRTPRSSVGDRQADRAAVHRLYVGFSVATVAGNRLLHVKEVAREAEYAKVDAVGRDMIGDAVAGVPAA